MTDKEIESFLKKHFPNYKINNASNRTMQELNKIMDICRAMPNLIVFLVRTNDNSSIFQFYEHKKKLKQSINLLFYFKENILFFESSSSESSEHVIRVLKQYIKNEIKCIVCYEKFHGCERNMRICEKCGASTCRRCILHMHYHDKMKVECPVCREPIIIVDKRN